MKSPGGTGRGTDESADIATAARAVAAEGIVIFPCHPKTKAPLVPRGFKEATSDLAVIEAWWRQWPKAMIGVPMGDVNGLFALDVDWDPSRGIDGRAALASLEGTHGPLPPTRTQRTPRGGEHRLFRWPGTKVMNSTSKIGAGIDVRGDGGYVIWAPSVNSDGAAYIWIELQDPADAPEWLLRLVVNPESAKNRGPGGASAGAGNGDEWRYAEAALISECQALAGATKGTRNTVLNRAAFNLGQLVGAGALERGKVEAALIEAATQCGLVGDDGLKAVSATIASGLDAGTQNPRQNSGSQSHGAPRPGGPADLTGFDLTEDGLALAFVKKHNDDLRFCHHSKLWYVWTGTHWRTEATGGAFDWARDVCRHLNVEGKAKLASAATAAAVERFAQADRRMAVTSELWDRDPFLLGTPKGTVELRSGVLRPADRGDYITRRAAVVPDKQQSCERWNRFLDEVTRGDKDLQRYLRQMAGYCLTGDVREHALFFVYGPGGNGKSVFLNTVTGAMGGYATTAAMDSFTAAASDRHPTDLAMLHGARLVSASEVDEGRTWAESRLKRLTGGDPIRARFMRQDFFEYRPQFKLVFVGNHLPSLRNVDDAARRRLNIIPFIHKPNAPDRDLEAKLQTEWPGILAWAIDGALDWEKNGLIRPAVVVNATEAYFRDQDLVRQWMQEECETGSQTYAATSEELFKSWSVFAEAHGERLGTSKSLSQTLIGEGYVSVSETPGRRKKRGFIGIRLKGVLT